MSSKRRPATRQATGETHNSASGQHRFGKSLLTYFCALGCGALGSVPLVDPSTWWLAWPAFAGLIATLANRSPGSAFRLGWCAGMTFSAVGTYWIPDTITHFSSYPAWSANLMFVGFCALTSLPFGFFGYLTVKLRTAAPILVYPVVWVACQFLWPDTFPWSLSYTQVQLHWLIQIAELTGVHGVSFLIVWFASLLYHTCALLVRRQGLSPVRGQAMLVAAVFILTLSFGWWRSHQLERDISQSPTMKVVLVQPGEQLWMKKCVELTKAIAGQVDLICWPESAVPGPFKLPSTGLQSAKQLNPIRASAIAVSGDLDTHLLFGTSSRAHNSPDRSPLHVSALLIDPAEQIVGRYHKRSLVPFGEYIPGERWFLSLRRFAAFPTRYVPGTSDEPLLVADTARLGVLICYEDMVPRVARASVKRGADVLVNLTNDFWFADSTAPRQHMHFSIFRAVENRRYLLRATTTGVSAIISPTGRVLAEAPAHQPATLTANVHLLSVTTLYTRWGDTFAWLCSLCVIFLAFQCRRSAKPAPKTQASA